LGCLVNIHGLTLKVHGDKLARQRRSETVATVTGILRRANPDPAENEPILILWNATVGRRDAQQRQNVS